MESEKMKSRILRRALMGAAILSLSVATAEADIKDYKFNLVTTELKAGEAEIAVKLTHTPSGRAIADAVIFATRLDMGPDDMAAMTTPLEPVASTEPGVYRFKTKLTMEGRWALSIGAKVQGEQGTVQDKLIIKAVP